MPHLHLPVSHLRIKKNTPTLPSEVVQISQRDGTIRHVRIIHLPRRGILGREIHNLLIGISDEIERQRLKETVALYEEDYPPRTGAVGEVLLDAAESCESEGLRCDDGPGCLRECEGQADGLRVVIKKGWVVSRGGMGDQRDDRFALGPRVRGLKERALSVEKVEPVTPGIKVRNRFLPVPSVRRSTAPPRHRG